VSQALRFTSADLDVMADDGKRYEIIDHRRGAVCVETQGCDLAAAPTG
jgi:hypothetical protein